MDGNREMSSFDGDEELPPSSIEGEGEGLSSLSVGGTYNGMLTGILS